MLPLPRHCHYDELRHARHDFYTYRTFKRVRRYYIIWLLKKWNVSVFNQDIIEVILTFLAQEGPNYHHYMRRRSRALDPCSIHALSSLTSARHAAHSYRGCTGGDGYAYRRIQRIGSSALSLT